MTNHTLSSYDKQLGQITDLIVEMGQRVKDLIHLARQSLTDRNQELADKAVALDKEINRLDYEIEHQATVVLALQNPMAVDLRFVTSALKIAGTLERAGDLCKNIAKRSVKLGDYVPADVSDMLDRMVATTVEMLDGALSAVKNRNPDLATAVWKRDDEVDELYHAILNAMQQGMLSDPNHILAYTHFVFATKNFERIADYATNLAKTVHYVTSGKPADKSIVRTEPDTTSHA